MKQENTIESLRNVYHIDSERYRIENFKVEYSTYTKLAFVTRDKIIVANPNMYYAEHYILGPKGSIRQKTSTLLTR